MSRLLKLALLVCVPVAIAAGVYWGVPRRADNLTAAKAAIDRRDFATARRDLDAHLDRRPRDAAVLLLAAQTARRDGDGPTAEAYLTRYLDAGGDADQARLERTLRAVQDGQVENASRMLAACAANPDDPAGPLILEALARGLVPAGPPKLALPCLDLWLSRPISPADRVQALVWRGRVLEDRQGLAAEAAEDYRRALDVDPDHPEARLRLARFLVRNRPAEALEHFQRLDRQSPGRREVVLGLVRTHHQLGDLDAAVELIQRFQPNQSNDPDVLVAAGALVLDRGWPKEAETLLRRAVALTPRGRDANVQLLRCLRELGDESAIRQQEAVVKSIEDEVQRQKESWKP